MLKSRLPLAQQVSLRPLNIIVEEENSVFISQMRPAQAVLYENGAALEREAARSASVSHIPYCRKLAGDRRPKHSRKSIINIAAAWKAVSQPWHAEMECECPVTLAIKSVTYKPCSLARQPI